MIKGQAVKTKFDPYSTGAYNVYDKPGGKKIGALPTSYVMGFFIDEKTVNGVSYTNVKLTQPLRGYINASIDSSKVYEWVPKTEYVIKKGSTNVNIRSGPSRSYSALKTMNSGESVGKTDGFKMGDFLLFKLTSGGYGWVHKDYVSVKTNASPKPSGGSNGGSNTGGGTTTTDEVPPTTGGLNISTYLRYGLILFGVVIVVSVIRGVSKDSAQKRLESGMKPSKKVSQ